MFLPESQTVLRCVNELFDKHEVWERGLHWLWWGRRRRSGGDCSSLWCQVTLSRAVSAHLWPLDPEGVRSERKRLAGVKDGAQSGRHEQSGPFGNQRKKMSLSQWVKNLGEDHLNDKDFEIWRLINDYQPADQPLWSQGLIHHHETNMWTKH